MMCPDVAVWCGKLMEQMLFRSIFEAAEFLALLHSKTQTHKQIGRLCLLLAVSTLFLCQAAHSSMLAVYRRTRNQWAAGM